MHPMYTHATGHAQYVYTYVYIHTYYIYYILPHILYIVYILCYIYICMCVCVCVYTHTFSVYMWCSLLSLSPLCATFAYSSPFPSPPLRFFPPILLLTSSPAFLVTQVTDDFKNSVLNFRLLSTKCLLWSSLEPPIITSKVSGTEFIISSNPFLFFFFFFLVWMKLIRPGYI